MPIETLDLDTIPLTRNVDDRDKPGPDDRHQESTVA